MGRAFAAPMRQHADHSIASGQFFSDRPSRLPHRPRPEKDTA